MPDPRTPARRGHDALQSLARRALATAAVGSSAGPATTVVISMSIDDLETRAGTASTATGATLPIPDAPDLAADTSWILGVLDRQGQPLWLSRPARLASGPQRKALFLRDGGCTRPGCGAPAAWYEAHHRITWLDGGPTDLHSPEQNLLTRGAASPGACQAKRAASAVRVLSMPWAFLAG